ncbi:hypothetical protein HPB48_026698 [Haemaphysalis longicornis]|uniref:Uncharacterized protein n=1 Tax=Haemaphysalis longicornis TaxID=44386 RepID=A0A9J6H1T2_HAELO|nr:hypothetical protein HPB48_026698 [Haemaphysalis longicornis]
MTTPSQLLSLEQQKQSLEKELSHSLSELKCEAARCQDLENHLWNADEKIQELLQVAKEKSGAPHQIQALGKQVEESQAIAKTLREVAVLSDSKRALEDNVQQLLNSVEELTTELEQKQDRLGCLQKEIVDRKYAVSSGAGKLRAMILKAAQDAGGKADQYRRTPPGKLQDVQNICCEVTLDVRQHLRFLEALNKLEKQRHDEEKRKMLLQAVRSRPQGYNAEQLKQRAHDL